MLTIYILIALASICYFWYYYLTRTFNYWKSRNVVGPKPVPLFGNLQDSAFRRKNIGVLFKEIYDAYPNEKVVGVFRMTTPCLLLRDLDVIKHVLIKDFDYFSDRGVSFGEKGLGNNLFHADSVMWRVLRNRFTPIFTSGKLKYMVYLLSQLGDKFIELVSDICQKQQEHEVHSLVQKYTIATISECAFGLKVDTISDTNSSIFKKIDNIVFAPTFIDEIDMMYPGILRKLEINPFPKDVPDFFEQLVKTVIEQRNGKPTDRKDFMDLILGLRQERKIQGPKRSEDENEITLELTDDIIAAQAFVFYAAGYETSATTMAFMLYALAKNPDIQIKVIAEVDQVLEKYDGKLSFEALNDLKYMEKVFYETLRFYPLVEPLQRKAQRDYKIPGMDVMVKKGQMVLISPLGIQHDEKYYPNPEKFDPERFSSENSSGRHTCAYLPFGTGPRNCIGMRFAKLQLYVCLAKLFSKFRVEPSKRTMPALRFIPRRFLMAAEGGIYLNIVRRDI
ncbi:unnamed protein product [Parnassius apollo]|uniref:unspecific monooxygenase n=1 Tax=Parnassius apollo TaxID=110799 RepID=A0A8S3WHE4_PARAO|nr:unnamed protein product [Parnassius apollo]